VGAPPGYVVSASTSGEVTPSEFESPQAAQRVCPKPAATEGCELVAAFHNFVTGYKAHFNSTQTPNDYIEVELSQFPSSQDANRALRAIETSTALAFQSCSTCGRSQNLRIGASPAIEIDGSTPEASGAYAHSIATSRGDVLITVDSRTANSSSNPLIATMAEQQYQKLA
jgi:hypothetical protein